MKKFLAKLDNFWYHYKWHTIFTVFFLTVFVICATQCAKKEDPDAMILYSGPCVVTNDGNQLVSSLFAECLDSDTNGDGKKLISLTTVTILSDEQINALKEAAKEDGETIYYDPAGRTQMFNQVKSWLVGGEMPLAVLDPYVYKLFDGLGLFVPLTEVFDEMPEQAYDEYAVSLDQTDFIRYHSDLGEFAENAVICLVKPTVISSLSGNTQEARYQVHLELFKNIVLFEVE